MTEIQTRLKDCQAGESAVKCLSQGHNRMAQVGFKPKTCRSQSRRSNHSTTLPTFKTWKQEEKFLFFTGAVVELGLVTKYQLTKMKSRRHCPV